MFTAYGALRRGETGPKKQGKNSLPYEASYKVLEEFKRGTQDRADRREDSWCLRYDFLSSNPDHLEKGQKRSNEDGPKTQSPGCKTSTPVADQYAAVRYDFLSSNPDHLEKGQKRSNEDGPKTQSPGCKTSTPVADQYAAAKTCDHPFEETPGGKCLFNPMGVLQVTWDEGQRICRWMNENGHLVEFQSYDELQDVTSYLKEHYGSCSHWSSVQWMDRERDNVLPILCEIPPRWKCPSTFSPVGGTCYYIGKSLLPWDAAQEFCHSLAPNGKLAELETVEEIYAVTEFLMKNGNNRHRWNDSPRTDSAYELCEADPADLSSVDFALWAMKRSFLRATRGISEGHLNNVLHQGLNDGQEVPGH
ncbi:unnamed protein product [Cyprideis torosa]|uniref:Uncharacterized protein n=1 Tax=Cyprideis torosa TaxID=163714 RepID=A0A7R8ZLW4_9CRUS|nr:unnamed protein product [Cyprideis torosa]CAG0892803.1 unnamed protein product [Cyprideis torosa]